MRNPVFNPCYSNSNVFESEWKEGKPTPCQKVKNDPEKCSFAGSVFSDENQCIVSYNGVYRSVVVQAGYCNAFDFGAHDLVLNNVINLSERCGFVEEASQLPSASGSAVVADSATASV